MTLEGGTAAELTARQAREVAYHAERAREMQRLVDEPIALDIATGTPRRPWNAYWHFWDLVAEHDLAGRKVLVPGSGYGENAVRLAALGAEGSGFDISPDSVAIAEARTAKAGVTVDYAVAPFERMPYADASFDAVVLVDIMHHVDVPAALAEIRRVLKPGGIILVNEIYTHDGIERAIRRNVVVEKLIYPLLTKWVYGTDKPYITEDERKLNDRELRQIEAAMTVCKRRWFNALTGRILPAGGIATARFDQGLLTAMGGGGRYLAGRVLLTGTR